MKHSYFKIPGWFNYSESYDIIVDQIQDNGKISEISTNRGNGTFVNDLGSLIEAYKSGKITKKEFDKKKDAILSE